MDFIGSSILAHGLLLSGLVLVLKGDGSLLKIKNAIKMIDLNTLMKIDYNASHFHCWVQIVRRKEVAGAIVVLIVNGYNIA